jgi:hypothetical protein
MREDHRQQTRIVVDGSSQPLSAPRSGAAPIAHQSRRETIGRRWRVALAAVMITCGAYVLLHGARTSLAPSPPPMSANWNVELSSTGSSPVTALVFGREAGLHLVEVPSANATAEERRRIPARIGAANVYMVSLGWSSLNVHTVSPPGAPYMAFTAQARFVQLYSSPSLTGIRTSWRQ